MADVVYTSFTTDVRGSIGQLNVSITSETKKIKIKKKKYNVFL